MVVNLLLIFHKSKFMIKGVTIKKLTVHQDDRGFFCELIRQSDDFFQTKFGQLSHSLAKKGVFKAWHLHKKQTDWTYCATGKIKLVLYDTRQKSSTFKELTEMNLGKNHRQVVKIPPGVAHGYKVVQDSANIIYLMNREYNPDDELRIPHHDPKINYDWNK